MNRIAFVALCGVTLAAQTKSLTQGPHRMELVVEKKQGTAWSPVDPGFVFSKGDHVRFRFKSNFSGHLYVMNQGTSGDYAKLFPRVDTGMANQVTAGKEYLVPQTTTGAFRVDGPAGHDVIYWVVSPVDLGTTGYKPAVPPPAKASTTLTPRCDSTILRARGECVDTSAGVQSVESGKNLPPNLKRIPTEQSRELVFLKKENQSVVSSPSPLAGPIVYEFRLAHK